MLIPQSIGLCEISFYGHAIYVPAILRGMNKKAFFTGLLILPLLTSPLLNPKPVNGQGASLSIFPPVIEVQATPPSSPSVPIVIQNNNDEDIELRIEMVPFQTNGATGEVVLNPKLMEKGFYSYYKDKVQFLEDNKKTETITLSALESKEITFNINIEKGDPPGDFYYSILFMAGGISPDETSASQIPTGIATNLLLSVGPKGTSNAGISEFSTDFFKSKGPVKFALKFHNASQHLLAPTGNIVITNLFGQKVGEIPLLPQYVLAGGDRYLIDSKQASGQAQLTNDALTEPRIIWPENFLFGWYNAKARIMLEENGRVIESSTSFFAFPLYFFFPLVVLIFITLSIYLRVKKKV